MKNQAEYYKKRATEYEGIYHKPERQNDLRKIEQYLERHFPEKSIIEIGCGTGYWTEILARNCQSIFAIDINEEVIDIAREKNYPKANVQFNVQDMRLLNTGESLFNGLFAGFIWSHIRKEDINEFLSTCLSTIKPSSELIFLDNKYVEGSSTPLSRKDEFGNTFQNRKLKSGTPYEVVKNFPTQEEFQEMLLPECTNLEWIDFDYYWVARVRKKA